MTTAPRLTIGVPVFNGGKYIDDALRSIAGQDFDDMEVVVSDNCSSDSTEMICRDYADRDSRFRYVRHGQNRGGVWNVNYLVRVARGDFFKWSYYDDRLRPGYVQACMEALVSAGSGVVAAHSRVVVIDQDGDFLEERADSDLGLEHPAPHERVRRLLRQLAGQLEFAVVRTDALRATRGIEPFIGSELALLTSLLIRGAAVQVPEQLLELRRHPDQYGATRLTEGAWYAYEHQRGRLLPFTWLNVELTRAVLRSNVSVDEKARCVHAVLAGWTIPRWRAVAGDLKALPQTWGKRVVARDELA